MTILAPALPDNAPFGSAQRAWINGWLAAFFASDDDGASAPAPASFTPPEEIPVATT